MQPILAESVQHGRRFGVLLVALAFLAALGVAASAMSRHPHRARHHRVHLEACGHAGYVYVTR
jgi:hypothetical protein